jgi:hypothetical protein
LLLSCTTHFPPQASAPAEQLQLPPVQVPAPQLLLQAPQFSGSLFRSTQRPLHTVFPAGQTQVPAAQIMSPTQRLPQPPQFPGSLASATHPPAHGEVLAGHDATQLDAEQFSVGPHAPAQLPGQSAPASQTHLPALQCAPGPQAIPQPPQLRLSEAVSTQVA